MQTSLQEHVRFQAGPDPTTGPPAAAWPGHGPLQPRDHPTGRQKPCRGVPRTSAALAASRFAAATAQLHPAGTADVGVNAKAADAKPPTPAEPQRATNTGHNLAANVDGLGAW